MAKILWVEDQTHWIDKFSPILQSSDFDGQDNDLQVFRFPDAAKQHINKMPKDAAPDIALLDAHMNGNSQAGFSVSRALRKKWPQIPVIYLSEHSGTGIEEQAFAETDARDFIAKHQRNIEDVLCWRIKALLRQKTITQENSGNTISSGSLKIDLDTWEVYWKNNKLMNPHNPQRPLAPTPRKILRYLVENSPRALNTEQIVDKLDADMERFSYANYRQHIKTLRSAFDQAAGGLDHKNNGIVTLGAERAYCWKPD